MGFSQQALYCYGKVHNLDQSNLNALWDRAALAKEIDDNRTVRVFRHFTSYDVESQ
jgi:general transcription factor 3C polypeptide 3 (transcription factor C subunit 4)